MGAHGGGAVLEGRAPEVVAVHPRIHRAVQVPVQLLGAEQQLFPDRLRGVAVGLVVQDVIHRVRDQDRLEEALVHVRALVPEDAGGGVRAAVACEGVLQDGAGLGQIGRLARDVVQAAAGLAERALGIGERRLFHALRIGHVRDVVGIQRLGDVQVGILLVRLVQLRGHQAGRGVGAGREGPCPCPP